MSERDNENKVVLRLVRTANREVICDQRGRPLEDVISFDYGVDHEDLTAYMTIRLRFAHPKWDEKLGVAIPIHPIDNRQN